MIKPYLEQEASTVKQHAAFIAIILLALTLRLPGCFSDFWLDEIWTLAMTNQMHSPIEIFAEFQHSNNHLLNTLVLYLLGDNQDWSIYRIHSQIAGLGLVILTYLIARRDG